MSELEELEAAMAAPDYQPVLGRPATVANIFGVTRQAITRLSSDPARTGVSRGPRGEVDVNAVARWFLRRDQSKVTRGR